MDPLLAKEDSDVGGAPAISSWIFMELMFGATLMGTFVTRYIGRYSLGEINSGC